VRIADLQSARPRFVSRKTVLVCALVRFARVLCFALLLFLWCANFEFSLFFLNSNSNFDYCVLLTSIPGGASLAEARRASSHFSHAFARFAGSFWRISRSCFTSHLIFVCAHSWNFSCVRH